jgi:uncharacterized lipoprotein YddW (UPF0748 family)
MRNKVWDGLKGHLTSSKWAKMTGVSHDTANVIFRILSRSRSCVLRPLVDEASNMFLKPSKMKGEVRKGVNMKSGKRLKKWTFVFSRKRMASASVALFLVAQVSANEKPKWVPMRGTAPATLATVEGQTVWRLPCNFVGTTIERASWDQAVKLDLSSCRGVQFKVFCRNTEPIARCCLYLQSGNGWYQATFYPEATNAWNLITLDKASMRTEGEPEGWAQIKRIRFSAWRGRDMDTELLLSDISCVDALGGDAVVAIVRADSLVQHNPEEAKGAVQYAEAVAQALQALDIGTAMMSDLEVTAEQLTSAKLVILPHNPAMPDRVVSELEKYSVAGGKLLAFYSVPARLRKVLGVTGGEHIRESYRGAFASMRFDKDALPGAPAVVGQRSWNINAVKPLPGGSRVFAEWLDDKGNATGHAAVVGSTNGLVMTHVLLSDDLPNKRRMLLAMIGYLVPDLWQNAVKASIARIGTLASYKNFDEAVAKITTVGRGNQRVQEAITDGKQLRASAIKLAADRKYVEALVQAGLASQRMKEAFCLAQRPEPGEFRGFWCHKATGVAGMEWDEAIKRLSDNGFTAILPNMLWGGVAFYDSQVLPVASPERGDQIAACLAACKKYNIEMHVWKVNWKLGYVVPAAFREKMRREGRLQRSSRGKEEPWLCPSHPDNQKLEVDAMVEVARKYDVTGIHFDYIRYPDNDHCFCAGCQERFQRAANVTLQEWPAEVLGKGALRQQWLEWRRGNITAVVKAVSEQARAISPKIKISAAVFRTWVTDRDSVGQDWKLWCEKGWLDFVCPMNYTESNNRFENMVSRQVQWAGKAHCYPGIGVSASSSQFGIDQLIEQILITRRYQTHGFMVFNYGVTESRELLPLLGLGITAPTK